MSEIRLTAAQARVLGSLLEKEATTPDYYPLSLNALANACNQRSNREPVMDLSEEEIRQALDGLEEMRLAGRARSADGRVAKYEHWLGEAFNFTRAESALVCVLLLRGAQTPGELRQRAERIHEFAEIADVLAALDKLMQRQPPLAAVLPRQPGARESRYAHLLADEAETLAEAGGDTAEPPARPRPPAVSEPAPVWTAAAAGSADERLARLEEQVADLNKRLTQLATHFEDLFGDGD
jgi:uncharacterized protein YceH (UPF0502 family)